MWSHASSISSSYERKHGSVCASCLVPGCCAQVALCKLLRASGSTSVFKLFCMLCKFLSARRSALVSVRKPELSCGGRALYVCASGLRFSGRSRQEYTPHTAASLLEPELPRTKEESNPRPRDCESRRANHKTTSKGHFASNKTRHSERFDTHDLRRGFAKTKTNSHGAAARARRRARSPQRVHPRTAKTQKNIEFFRPRPRRGSRGQIRHRKKARVFAPRPRRSPQRVAQADRNRKKSSSFCTSTTQIPAEGRAGQIRNRKKPRVFEFLHLFPLPIPAEKRAGRSEIAKNLQFLYLDHADPRRGSQTRSTIKVLPRRPRKLNVTYIAEALCAWLYALGSMHLALYTWLYALGSLHSALCTRLCALGSMHLGLCAWLYALGSMRLALCAWLYALASMHGCTHLAPCTWLYALGSMQLALFALQLGSMQLGSMHLALCTALCTWLHALGSMCLTLRK